jgi:hypothetical protein
MGLETLAPERHLLVFIPSSLAILLLAGSKGRATEQLAERMAEGVGGLLNATFGNATELIIALAALRAELHDVVKASTAGSIVGNILLVLGTAMLAGGLRRSEQDDRTTLCGECETFRLAIQIAEPPRINERSGAATRREIIEPRNRGGFVAEQIEAPIRTYLEVTEVGASFGQCLVGKPDCESNDRWCPFLIGHRSFAVAGLSPRRRRAAAEARRQGPGRQHRLSPLSHDRRQEQDG